MITRNTGSDLLPLGGSRARPGGRPRAVVDAELQHIQDNDRDYGAPFDARRLVQDLRSIATSPHPEVRVAERRELLRGMGWRDEDLRRAGGALRELLDRRVNPKPYRCRDCGAEMRFGQRSSCPRCGSTKAPRTAMPGELPNVTAGGGEPRTVPASSPAVASSLAGQLVAHAEAALRAGASEAEVRRWIARQAQRRRRAP